MPYLIEQTDTFARWHASLRDLRAHIAIARRIERAATGNLGDVKSVGGGVSELRVDVGAGYRVYYTLRRGMLVIVLCGGDKRSQKVDIKRAQQLAMQV